MSSKRANDTMKEFDLVCKKIGMSIDEHKKLLDVFLKLLRNMTQDFSLTLLKMTCEDLKKEQEEIIKEKQNKEGVWADPVEDKNPGNLDNLSGDKP